jgi:hypothetical protein
VEVAMVAGEADEIALGAFFYGLPYSYSKNNVHMLYLVSQCNIELMY